MKRRNFLKTMGGASLAYAMHAAVAEEKPNRAGAEPVAPGTQRPNILLIMADQFRGDCLGAAGHPAVKTPNLDRIAAEGVRFSSAYSCTPTCTPARAALLTGMSPWRHGMLGYGRVGEQYPVEMPRALRDAGYYTCGIGKMHWHPQRNGHGFHQMLLEESGRAESPDFRSDYRSWFFSEAPTLDPDATGIGWNDYTSAPYVLPERLHPTQWMGDCAVRFLSEYRRAEPFFLKVSFARPHSPYDPPEAFWRQYENAPIPPAQIGDWAQRYAPRSGPDASIWHGDLGPEQVRRSRQGYYGSISFLDQQIGRILDMLEQLGILDNTLIVFTSDHGDMTGDHHLWRKSYAYEASAHIPLLLRCPKTLAPAARGQVSTRPVELRDILPTFLEAAGAPGQERLDGQSLLALARDPDAFWRAFIDLEHDICYDAENHWNALTDGLRKYIYHACEGREQYFNLERDPRECKDLAGDASSQGELAGWRQRMVDHLAERGEAYVKKGKLMPRPQSQLYSPNYPGCKCHPQAVS
jgi:arylsulfatase